MIKHVYINCHKNNLEQFNEVVDALNKERIQVISTTEEEFSTLSVAFMNTSDVFIYMYSADSFILEDVAHFLEKLSKQDKIVLIILLDDLAHEYKVLDDYPKFPFSEIKKAVAYIIMKRLENTFGVSQLDIGEVQKQLKDKIEELQSGGWVGSASQQFHEEMQKTILPSIDKLSDALKAASESLQQVAQDFTDKDEEEIKEEVLVSVGGENAPSQINDVNPVKSDIATNTRYVPEPIQFTLFNPSQVKIMTRYSLLVYAHIASALDVIKKDANKFRDELGGSSYQSKSSRTSLQIDKNTPITIIPYGEGIEFNPPQITKKLDDEWVRFLFDFKIDEKYLDDELWIRISIQVKGIEVAYIKSSSKVIANSIEASSILASLTENPLDQAKSRNFSMTIAELYRQIFLSYSHDDQSVALKRAEEIEKLLGDRVFIDVKSLRQGEDWESKLAQAIDDADIFHLLWSENSSKSQYCRYEWEYALKSKCPETRCVGVIRPIYWQDPMPKAPPELAHLHFQKVELE